MMSVDDNGYIRVDPQFYPKFGDFKVVYLGQTEKQSVFVGVEIVQGCDINTLTLTSEERLIYPVP